MTISELGGFQRQLRSGGLTETSVYGNNKMTMDPVITYWEYDNFRAWRISKEGRKEGSCGLHLEIHAGLRGWRI